MPQKSQQYNAHTISPKILKTNIKEESDINYLSLGVGPQALS